jgi:hypothetical protein
MGWDPSQVSPLEATSSGGRYFVILGRRQLRGRQYLSFLYFIVNFTLASSQLN